MNNKRIPFNKPFIIGKELEYIYDAINSNSNISGNGPYTVKCQKWLESNLNVKRALLTHSCTGALEMTAILADIQPGDEIIMPSYTFVSCANAFVLRGGIPVFIDIRPDTLNIDEREIEAAITEKTKAIVPVHYAGIACEMDTIMDIAKKYNLLVIEDAAQGILSEYKGKKLGSIGHFGCLSFHETKNIISGEGGALLINDESLIERSEIIWEKGTDRQRYFKGQVSKYTWRDIGSSFLPSDITGAFLYAQLEFATAITDKRVKNYYNYYNLLKPLEDAQLIKLPHVPDKFIHNGHLFYLITKTAEVRQKLLKYLKDNGISAVFHYIPLHSSPVGKKYKQTNGNLSNTENLSSKLIRLPNYHELSYEDCQFIVQKIYDFFSEFRRLK